VSIFSVDASKLASFSAFYSTSEVAQAGSGGDSFSTSSGHATGRADPTDSRASADSFRLTSSAFSS